MAYDAQDNARHFVRHAVTSFSLGHTEGANECPLQRIAVGRVRVGGALSRARGQCPESAIMRAYGL
jgi:hypothetical protein